MSKRVFILAHATARRLAVAHILNDAPEGHAVTIAPPTRSLEQNAKLWALLGDVAEQVEWYGRKLTPEDWKHVFSASLRKLSVVPNLDGSGFVALGLSTSRMSRGELSELIELIQAFGAERDVQWSDEGAQLRRNWRDAGMAMEVMGA